MAIRVLEGDCRDILTTLPAESAHCVVTSPPYYGLRDYGTVGQLGLEPTPAEYIAQMVAVFREVRRVLRSDGTCWINIGDSYAGSGKGPTGHNGIGNQERRQGFTGGTFRNGKAYRDHAVDPRKGTAIPGLKPKDLIGIPWMLAFALRDDGWYLRSDIIWSKPNPMPESVTDRPTKAHEYVFLLTKSARYYYDADAIREPHARDWEGAAGLIGDGASKWAELAGRNDYNGRSAPPVFNPAGRNKRTVWEIATEAFPEAHFATYPTALVEPCIKAGSPKGGTVLDPFCGAGTTLLVADRLEREAIGIELSPVYAEMSRRRLVADAPMFVELAV